MEPRGNVANGGVEIRLLSEAGAWTSEEGEDANQECVSLALPVILKARAWEICLEPRY